MSDLETIRKSIAGVAFHLARMGWSEGNAGNISVLLPRGTEVELGPNPSSYHFPEPQRSLAGRTIMITATGSRFRRMKLDLDKQIVPMTITEFGTAALWPSEYPDPTSELGTHVQVHSLAPDLDWKTSAIVHTHSTGMLALSSSDIPGDMLQEAVDRAHPEITILMRKGISFIDFAPPGTWQLGTETMKCFRKSDAVVWRKHGILGFAPDLELACDYVEMTEKAAQILLLARSAFGCFQGLKDRELDSLRGESEQD